MIKGSIQEVTKQTVSIESFPWRVHFSHMRCRHRIWFALEHMVWRSRSARASFEDGHQQTHENPCRINLQKLCSCKFIDQQPQILLQGKNQLAWIDKTCLICEPRARAGKRNILQKSAQQQRCGLKRKTKTVCYFWTQKFARSLRCITLCV